MKIVTCITAFLFAASLSAADRNCEPECVDPWVCDEKISGTCCCPFPAHAYPSVGTGEYHILDAYRVGITAEDFSTSDNTLSDFWSLWDEPGTDFVELNATFDGNTRQRSTTGFQSEGDALVRAKAAWNDSGLFDEPRTAKCTIIDKYIIDLCPRM